MFHDSAEMIELLTPGQMARADALTIAGGESGMTLMLRAGRAVAEAAEDFLRARGGRRVAVLCGPGNNGGDGYVAASLLREKGFEVAVGALGDPRALKGDAAQSFFDWGDRVCAAEKLDLCGADLIVDALFGAGLSRPLDGAARALVERVNAAETPALAVDIPSGLDGATGAIGAVAVRACETVTFFRLKPGHLLFPGRANCGALRLAQIGIEPPVLDDIAPRNFLNAPPLWREALPRLCENGHKYDRGHLIVASGPLHATGAARLCARAGLRVGAGLVTLASPREALAVNAAHLTAIMLRPVDGAAEFRALLADRRFSALAIGPGFGVGPATRDTVLAVLEAVAGRGFGLVLDADALTSFAGDSAALARAIAASGAQLCVTPHHGEFLRLFAGTAAVEPGLCKLERARIAAGLLGAVVVDKGPDTVVAAPDGRAAIANNAPPTLATAGSGDVLAGLVAGLLAQTMPAFEAACAAVWLHGEAANLFGHGLIAEDLSEILPLALAGLAPSPRS